MSVYIAYVEQTKQGERIRLSHDLQQAMVSRAIGVIVQYTDGLMRPIDDWRVLVAVGQLVEWATDPFWGMLEWTQDIGSWERTVEPALQELFGTPFEAQARNARRVIKWAQKQWALPEDQRHPIFSRFVAFTPNSEEPE